MSQDFREGNLLYDVKIVMAIKMEYVLRELVYKKLRLGNRLKVIIQLSIL